MIDRAVTIVSQVEAPADPVGDVLALEEAAAVVSGRWKHAILRIVAEGPRRRAEITRALPAAATAKVVTEQLRALQADGIVERVDRRAECGHGARHVVYALTPLGRELIPAVCALGRWGAIRRRVRSANARPGGDGWSCQPRSSTAHVQSTSTCVTTGARITPVR
jgi:DNA-binding HxlR family transcriptional regulator